MIFSKTLYEGKSEYGTLKVQKRRGTINLVSGRKYLQSSYRPGKPPVGTVWDYFLVAPLFAPNPDEVKDVCILGLGAGVAVKLLNQFYDIERIVGVDIDPVVVDLGKRFFDLNDDNLEIRIQDAAEYVQESSEVFDLILIDAFKGNAIDPRCSCREFYAHVIRHLKPDGVVLINRVDNQKPPSLFAQCYELAVRNNIFYLGLQKPLPKQIIMERLEKFTRGFNGRNAVLKTTSEVYRRG